MAYNHSMATLAIAATKALAGEALSVVELGNQTFKAREHGNFPSTKAFYESLGFTRYLAIDINEEMDAVAMDLNSDLREAYGFTEQFDLVTNNGTGEHLFDQRQVFENVHNLCKPGGLMLHQLPAVGWVSHGHFCIQPVLYCDLAAANGYSILNCGLADAKGKIINMAPSDFGRAVKRHTRDEAMGRALDRLGWENANAFCLMRKTTDDPFRIPLQGKYVADIDSTEIAARYVR
jgi:SAM-dependent methyltransferase